MDNKKTLKWEYSWKVATTAVWLEHSWVEGKWKELRSGG